MTRGHARWPGPPLLLVLFAGCHETSTLPAPDLTGAQALILAYRVDGVLTRVEALDPSQPLPLFSRPASEPLDILAATYSCPLDAYELKPGPLFFQATPAATSALPPALRLATLHVDPGAEPVPWAVVGEDDPDTSAILRRVVVSTALCPGIQEEPVVIDADPSPTRELQNALVEGLVRLPDGRALVVTSTGPQQRSVFVVDGAGQVTETALAYRGTRTSTLPGGALGIDARGQLWHVSRTGTVARGTLEGGLDVVEKLDVGRGAVVSVTLVEVPGQDEPRVFIATSTTSDARVIERGYGTPIVRSGDQFGSPIIGVVGPDELLIANVPVGAGSVTRARRNAAGAWALTTEDLPRAGGRRGAEVTASIEIAPDGRETLVDTFLSTFGTLRGVSFVEKTDGAWTRVGGVDDTLSVLSVSRLPGELLLLAGYGAGFNSAHRLLLHQRGVGVCYDRSFRRPERYTLIEGAIRAVALDDDTWLAVPGWSEEPARFIRRTRRTPACITDQP